MPPLPGPRVVSWCTRHPVKTSTEPSSIRTGIDTSSTRSAVAEDAVDVGIEVDQLGGVVEAFEDRLPSCCADIEFLILPGAATRTLVTAGL